MNMTVTFLPAFILVACTGAQYKPQTSRERHWVAQQEIAMPSSSKPVPPELRPVLPGTPVPGSRIAIPGTVKAGAALQGRVPVGSRVEINGQEIAVDESGQFSYPVAETARGSLNVRIKRPAPDTRPPMPLQVRIVR